MMIDKNRDLKLIMIDTKGRIMPSYLGDKGEVLFDDNRKIYKNVPFYHEEFIISTLKNKCNIRKRALEKISKDRGMDLLEDVSKEGYALIYDLTNYEIYNGTSERDALLFLPPFVSEPLKKSLIDVYNDIEGEYKPIRTMLGLMEPKKKDVKKFKYNEVEYYSDLVEVLKHEKGISK